MSLVSLVKIRRSTINSMEQAILEALNLINYSFGKEIENVVIKPNLCYYWDYSTGQTTDPRFVAALIELIRKKIATNVRIHIVESDASAMKCKYAFRMLGYEKLAQDYGVQLINLSEDRRDVVHVAVAERTFPLMIPETIQKADLKINISKIKYTAVSNLKITCALKNIFGCNSYPKKYKYHPQLEETIVAINKAMKFDLCLIDANIVSGIQPRKLGLVMASEDPVAIDVAAAKIAGENPSSIRCIQLACKEGLGNTRFVSKGESLSYFKARYPKKDVRQKLMSQAYGMIVRTGLSKRLGLQ